jgi:hypothetical protein
MLALRMFPHGSLRPADRRAQEQNAAGSPDPAMPITLGMKPGRETPLVEAPNARDGRSIPCVVYILVPLENVHDSARTGSTAGAHFNRHRPGRAGA